MLTLKGYFKAEDTFQVIIFVESENINWNI